MDIVWRTKFGEKGRIQTGQLKAVVRETYCSWSTVTRFSSDGSPGYQVFLISYLWVASIIKHVNLRIKKQEAKK